ncbi:MAG: ornithine carbamoyltransferase [Nitrospirae bacterium GWD2_57_9]|nr:MAG: ornithine carbamoyltransferase [Nitrospirae bacterium GWD2_57_9]OGW48922.1 MAG: ornithine carbamoyltransferase [Nitrospirae bacterium GWC2_57_9]
MKKDLLAISDLTLKDIEHILKLSASLKKMQKQGKTHQPLKGKSLGMIFEKSSTRTRVSFEVGMYQLGGQALFLSPNDLQIGRGEPLADTARTLSRYLDGIMIRTFAQTTVEELARNATIPVINGLTDLHHPCQALADLFTIKEKRGKLKGLRFAYIGDGNNMAHSLIEACVKTGIHVALACPPGYEPDAGIMREARQAALISGSELKLSNDPIKAAGSADVVYTDVWASMGQESEHAKRISAFRGFQVDPQLMQAAAHDALVMHCLPAHRGEEIAAEVIDGPQSVIFDQAENRLHAQKALLEILLG